MKTSIRGLSVVGILLTAIATTAVADDAKDAAIKKDRKQIAGTWRLVGLSFNGIKGTDEQIDMLRWALLPREDFPKFAGKATPQLTVVNGDDGTWSLRIGDKEISKGTSTFDPTKKPKTIDFAAPDASGKKLPCHGIYELGETTRKLCFTMSGERPTDFSAPEKSDRYLVTFERVKTK